MRSSGFVVEVAIDAQDGWAKLQLFRPDLVITDVMMPRVDGYQFLQQLREDDRFKSLPVIFLTARGMTRDRIQGYNAGCDAYLSKPFDPDELVSMVNNLLKRRDDLIQDTPGGGANMVDMARQVAEIRDLLLNRGNSLVQTDTIKIDLTPREQSVLNLVAKGLMNKEIARELETSVRNVEKYVSRLFSKTDTNSRTELVRFALEHGMVQD